jgi:chromosome partitioning protein
MDVVAIISQKGGVGKTTLTLSLAVAAQRAGKTVAIVDLDPQATACNWGDRRDNEAPVIVSAQAARLPQVLKSAEDAGAEFVVIDTPPRAEQAAMSAAKAANLILIPCRPAVFDLDTVSTTLELISHAGNSAIAAILNGVPPRGSKGEQASEVIKGLNITVCPVWFGHRAAFSDSGAVGQSAQEYDPGGKAADEIEQVYKFACKLLNSTTNKGVSHGKTSRLATSNER